MMKTRIGTISRLAVLALAATACVAAPVSTPSPGTSPSAAPPEPSATESAEALLTATLDDGGCSLDGGPALDPGPVTITVVNDDPTDRATFQLLRVHQDGTVDELATHIAEEQTRIDAGTDPIGIPAYASEVTGTLIEAGTQDQLKATLQAGTYTMVCADWADGGEGSVGRHPDIGGRLLIAGSLTVGTADGLLRRLA